MNDADDRIAEKGGKPEDQGLNFPEYACHGGGTFNALSVFHYMKGD